MRIGTRAYEYNAEHRPIKLSIDGQLRAEYTYNAWGERIRKVVYHGGQKKVTYYLYDGNQLTAEADGERRIRAQYSYLGHRPIAKLEGKTIYAIHTDHLGTPQAVTDEDGEVVWQAEYAPFGKAYIHKARIALNLRFPGQYADEEAGTHYNYFRDYDPETGRYITSDPIGLSGGVNTYAYADASPIEYADVLGLRSYQFGLADPTLAPDPGAGTWNSVPPTLIRQTQKAVIRVGMGVFPWPNAKPHLQHYFNNSGSDYTINLQEMLDQVTSAQGVLWDEMVEAMDFAEAQTLAPGQCYSITSGSASTGYHQESESSDWYYAVGGYSAWGKGTVSIDADGNYTMYFEYKFFDRYNWDNGKSVTIAGITVTDQFMGDFHRMGLAQEFDMHGSVRQTLRWTRGASPTITNGWGH